MQTSNSTEPSPSVSYSLVLILLEHYIRRKSLITLTTEGTKVLDGWHRKDHRS